MKVLYILPYDWGAMPQYTSEIANAVSEYCNVVVIGSKSINSDYFSKNIEILKVFDSLNFNRKNLKILFSFSNVRSYFSFKRLSIIREINPDVIHIPAPLIPPLSIFIRFYKLDLQYPIVYTKHCLVSYSDTYIKFLEESVLGFFENLISFDKVVLHTENDRKTMLKSKYGIKEDKIVVIPHGVYSLFQNYGRKYSVDNNTILFFGNILEYKGLRYLLQAIPSIAKEIPDLKIIIAGKGDLSEYESLINICGRSRFEIYNKFISDEKVSELFQRAKIFVIPYSEMSGQSGVLNVALAFNKPVVASDVGGFSEIIINRETGLLVPPKDPNSLKNAILELLKDDILRSKIEKNFHCKAQELSWNNIAKKYVKLYSGLATE